MYGVKNEAKIRAGETEGGGFACVRILLQLTLRKLQDVVDRDETCVQSNRTATSVLCDKVHRTTAELLYLVTARALMAFHYAKK